MIDFGGTGLSSIGWRGVLFKHRLAVADAIAHHAERRQVGVGVAQDVTGDAAHVRESENFI
jgi:hypothetical protein